MINEQLTSYVTTERARGVADDAIRSALLTQGWKEEDVVSVMGGLTAITSESPRILSFGNLFEGRLGRWQYFLTSILLGLAVLVVVLILGIFAERSGMLSMILIVLMYIAVIPLSVSLSIRRIHDNNWNGWLFFILFIPLVNFVFSLILLFKKGTEASNTYGPPQADRNFKNTLLNL